MNAIRNKVDLALKNKVVRLMCYMYLIISVFLTLFPFFWMLVSSTNSNFDVQQRKLTFGTYFFNNLRNLIEITNFTQAYRNSLVTATLGCISMLIVCSMAGYGFSKYRSPGKTRVYGFLMLSLMIPFSAIMIPLFRLMVSLNLINTLTAVVLPSISSVFLMFFFRQNFVKFPAEIIESARIDGAGEFRIFLSIVVPSMKATYAAGAIWAFMFLWNNFLWPLLIIRTPAKQTLPLVLSAMSGAWFPDYGMIMLAVLLMVLPILVLFLILQEHFVSGIVGASK